MQLVKTGASSDLEESSPLLSHESVKPTPLPLLKLCVLTMVRVAEPLTYTQIFPYVNEMIEELEIASGADIGYYSGIVDSTCSFAQLLTVYFWSSLSDRIGRKPVLLIGLTGAVLSAGSFGFSRTLTMMVISRVLQGMMSGNVAVTGSMLAEMTDKTNEGAAFALIGTAWNIGSILGPMIGGNLSHPVERYPRIFGGSQFLRDYPFALPCLVSASLTLGAVLLCAIFVDETLPSKLAPLKARNPARVKSFTSPVQEYGSIPATQRSKVLDVYAEQAEASPLPIAQATLTASSKPDGGVMVLFRQPLVRAALASGCMLSFMGVAFEVVFVLYAYTRVDLGGMGRSPAQIGYALAGSGFAATCFGVFVFPRLQRRFNNHDLYVALASIWPLGFAIMPIGNIAAQIGGEKLIWASIATMLAPIRFGGLVYPLNMIIAKASVGDPRQLGAMFGLQQTCSSVARGIAPTFVSTLFAFSIERQWLLHGGFVWVFMMFCGFLTIWVAARVVDLPAPAASHRGKSKQLSAGESH